MISYPEWVHGIGYFLILVAAAQFPVWAMLQMLYYLCHPKKKVSWKNKYQLADSNYGNIFSLWTCSDPLQSGARETELRRKCGLRKRDRDVSVLLSCSNRIF